MAARRNGKVGHSTRRPAHCPTRVPTGLARLKRAAGLFLDVLRGVRSIHRLPGPGAHLGLDLKAVGLVLDGASPSAAIVDLSRASDEDVRSRFGPPPKIASAEPYAAPELCGPEESGPYEVELARLENGVVLLRLPMPVGAEDPIDPPFTPGDVIRYESAESGETIAVIQDLKFGKQDDRFILVLSVRPMGDLPRIGKVGGRLGSGRPRGLRRTSIRLA